jgi:hypothetical protein
MRFSEDPKNQFALVSFAGYSRKQYLVGVDFQAFSLIFAVFPKMSPFFHLSTEWLVTWARYLAKNGRTWYHSCVLTPTSYGRFKDESHSHPAPVYPVLPPM